jgi:hypothetical protein
MKRGVMCMSIVAAFMASSYCVVAQSTPKYEIFEYGYNQQTQAAYYSALLIDRVANKIWNCHGDIDGSSNPLPTLGCFEVKQVVLKGGEAFPNLAQLATAQQRIITSNSHIDAAIWLVDQSNGNVHFCLTQIPWGGPTTNGNVWCYALPRHPL